MVSDCMSPVENRGFISLDFPGFQKDGNGAAPLALNCLNHSCINQCTCKAIKCYQCEVCLYSFVVRPGEELKIAISSNRECIIERINSVEQFFLQRALQKAHRLSPSV